MLARVLWVTLLVASAPLTVPYFIQLWDLPHYQYFPALLLALGGLTWARWDKQLLLPSGKLAWVFIALACLNLMWGAYTWSPWLGAVGLIFMLGAFYVTHQPTEGVTRTAWGLLHLWPSAWMLLRLPLNLDYQLTGWLQSSTAVVSSHLLDRIGLVHRLSGNVFTLPKGTLFVEAACSGVQSAFSLLFCAVLLVAWNRRPPLLLPVYAGAALLWAGIMNILRVVAIAIAQEQFDLDLAHGWKHETLGYVCLAMAVVLLLSTDRLMRVLFFPVPDHLDSVKTNPMRNWWNHVFYAMQNEKIERTYSTRSKRGTDGESNVVSSGISWATWSQRLSQVAVPLVVCCVFVPQVVAAIRHFTEVTQPNQTEFWEPDKNLLSQVPGLKVLEYQTAKDSSNPTLGVHAHMWIVDIGGVVTRVVASQHNEVHDLCTCYRANGWRIDKRQLVSSDGWDYVKADCVNGDSIFGSLFFSTLDAHAKPVKLSSWSIKDLLRARLNDRESPDQVSFHGVSVNVQLWTTSETPITPEQIEVLRTANIKIRQVIQQDLAAAKS